MIIVCHYGEIALKKGNRKFFEEKLMENIRKALSGDFFKLAGADTKVSVKRIGGRILVELNGKGAWLREPGSRARLLSVLQKVFGLSYLAVAEKCEVDIEKIKAKACEVLANKNFQTFKVFTTRGDKQFSLSSQQVNELVGEAILENCKLQIANLKVNLENPDITLYIEITEKGAFLYTEKIKGLGGLPVGTGGKAVCLLSGGIDSPVAGYFTQKRGVELIFVHFHSAPYTDKASIEKVREVIAILNQYQFKAKMYLVPFADMQKEILLRTESSLRVIFYRRFMMRIAEKIAQNEIAMALITGDSIGQVASQTLPNILAIEEAVKIPILRPLIGFDKQEIIEKAKGIGTYEISIRPHQDCCSRFLPQFPETKADIARVKKEEKKLNVSKLVKTALKNTQVEII